MGLVLAFVIFGCCQIESLFKIVTEQQCNVIYLESRMVSSHTITRLLVIFCGNLIAKYDIKIYEKVTNVT